jgi:enoyl-CoA hydratase/carnithine racemase
LRIGLCDEIVAPEQLHERAYALAAECARGAVVGQGLAKQAIDEGMQRSLADGLRLELELFTDVFRSADSQIGVASFLENGPGKAAFTGR